MFWTHDLRYRAIIIFIIEKRFNFIIVSNYIHSYIVIANAILHMDVNTFLLCVIVIRLGYHMILYLRAYKLLILAGIDRSTGP